MTSAGFVICPGCGRLMLGHSGRPQPHDCPPASTLSTQEVWFGNQWRPAHVTVTKGDGWVRAVVYGGGNRELTFSPREVRPISGGRMTDRDELRRVAEAATPGPWRDVEGDLEGKPASEYVRTLLAKREEDGTSSGRLALTLAPNDFDPERGPEVVPALTGDGPRAAANAAHIATFDPPTVLALLDDLEAAEERHRDLVSRLGFGDGITEPMADNDTIADWFEEQSREASEWRESQRWRDDCAAAGHPDDEDCYEHDPARRLERAEAALARLVEGVRGLRDGIERSARRARSAASGQGDATWARLDGMATQADATVSDLTALLAEVEGAADE